MATTTTTKTLNKCIYKAFFLETACKQRWWITWEKENGNGKTTHCHTEDTNTCERAKGRPMTRSVKAIQKLMPLRLTMVYPYMANDIKNKCHIFVDRLAHMKLLGWKIVQIALSLTQSRTASNFHSYHRFTRVIIAVAMFHNLVANFVSTLCSL